GIRDKLVTGVQTCALPIFSRQVKVRFILEHFDPFQQELKTHTFKQLGAALLEGSRIFIWPEQKRTQVGGEWRGVLHTKCVVQDRSEERRVGKERRSGWVTG